MKDVVALRCCSFAVRLQGGLRSRTGTLRRLDMHKNLSSNTPVSKMSWNLDRRHVAFSRPNK